MLADRRCDLKQTKNHRFIRRANRSRLVGDNRDENFDPFAAASHKWDDDLREKQNAKSDSRPRLMRCENRRIQDGRTLSADCGRFSASMKCGN